MRRGLWLAWLVAAAGCTFNPGAAQQALMQANMRTLQKDYGAAISLSHKRLAGVLAWWTPGCRDVVNSLDIVPPERDSDEEVQDALAEVRRAERDRRRDHDRAGLC